MSQPTGKQARKQMKKTEKYTLRANNSKRTITIRHYIDGKLFSKYRSFKLNKEDWQYYGGGYATENDIKQFLKSSDYYIVK